MALALCLPDARPRAASYDRASGEDVAAAVLIRRAAEYVGRYEDRLGGIVGEERSTQRLVRANGITARLREIVSDIILLPARDGTLRTLVVRDVIAVDSRPEPDGPGHLQRLFDGPPHDAAAEARALVDDSARYDLEFPHLRGVLTLPLLIVKLGTSGRFRFDQAGDGVSFSEVGSPTVVTYREDRRLWNVPVHGRLGLDAATGALRSADVRGVSGLFEGAVEVRFEEPPLLGLSVPVDMRETYRRPSRRNADHLEIVSSYSNFRRFDVKVDEAIQLPR